MINFVKDFRSQEAIDLFTSIIQEDRPVFVTRLGGNEYELCKNVFTDTRYLDQPDNYTFWDKRLRADTGYFDFDNNWVYNLHKFVSIQTRCYKDAEYSFFANASLINPILAGQVPDEAFLNYLIGGKTSICYGFVEGSTPFLQSFKTWGEGKKILVISPFEESVKVQYSRKDLLLENYTFPDFELLTYKTKVLYNYNTDSKEDLGVTTNNWDEEWQRMAEAISKLDFDVAWLSCASYANVLGDFIAHKMGKKAIYIGGMLNMFFNIYGGRYTSYTGRNLQYNLDPIENAEIEHIKAGRHCNHEAINAYFGHINH